MDMTAPEVTTDQLVSLLADLVSAVDRSHELTLTHDVSEALFQLRTYLPSAPPPKTDTVTWRHLFHDYLGV